MNLIRSFTINALWGQDDTELDRPIRMVDWTITFTPTDPDYSHLSSTHGGQTMLTEPKPESFIPFDQVTPEQVEQWVISLEGGPAFITMLEEMATEYIQGEKLRQDATLVYEAPTRTQPQASTAGNLRREGDLVVWTKTFAKGEVRVDTFPTPDHDFYDLAQVGDWVTKPHVTFMAKGSFTIEAADGSVYRMLPSHPPRLWMPAGRFKITALEEGSEFVCILHRQKSPLVQYDYERHILDDGQTLDLMYETSSFAYIAQGKAVRSSGVELNEGDLIQLGAGESETLTAVAGLNVVVAHNPRDYQFDVTHAEPDHAVGNRV